MVSLAFWYGPKVYELGRHGDVELITAMMLPSNMESKFSRNESSSVICWTLKSLSVGNPAAKMPAKHEERRSMKHKERRWYDEVCSEVVENSEIIAFFSVLKLYPITVCWCFAVAYEDPFACEILTSFLQAVIKN